MNTLQVLYKGLKLTANGFRQTVFIKSFLKPLVLKYCRQLPYKLSPTEEKKILFYYPMYTVLACGQMYTTIKGRSITKNERQRLTLVGAMATICDDLIDEDHWTRVQIFDLLQIEKNEASLPKRAKLLLALYNELQALGPLPRAFMPQLKMALHRQAASARQADRLLSLAEVENICREKNGHTSLMFATLLDEEWSSTELQFIYQSAMVGQLTNDGFDMYFDTKNNVQTYFNAAAGIQQVHQFFMNEIYMLHQLVMESENKPADKKATIQRMSILHAFTLTAITHLQDTENKYPKPINWKRLPRKDLITDMSLTKNRLRTIKYMQQLGKILPGQDAKYPAEKFAIDRAGDETISTITYDEAKQLLGVQMLADKEIYQYANVTTADYMAFIEADSIQVHYKTVIKPGYYKHSNVEK